MPSENLHTLYKRLMDVVDQTAAAFDGQDVSALTELTRKHGHIMAALKEQGDCRENDMLKIMKKINERIGALNEKIREQRDDLCEQLVMSERKKQAVAVYTGNNFRPRPNRHPSHAHRNPYTR